MKLAVAGKGGVGKTTLAAGLCFFLARRGFAVWAVDADPDVSLGAALGFPPALLEAQKPLIEMKELVEERTGQGSYLVLNPRVDDLLARYSCRQGDIRLLRMGGVKPGGSECYCKESSFLRAVLAALLLGEHDAVVLDMGAGIEGLTRGTARGVDLLLVVTEPTPTSARSAEVIAGLGADLGIARVGFVANKVRNAREEEYLGTRLGRSRLLGCIRHDTEVLDLALADGAGPVVTRSRGLSADLEQVGRRVLAELGEGPAGPSPSTFGRGG